MTKSKSVIDDIQTPALVLPAYFGQLLYTPPDLAVTNQDQQLGLYDIADLVQRDFGSSSIASLGTVSPNLVPIMSYRGSNGPAVNADNKGIAIQTKTGRRQVSVEQYLQRMKIDKPKIITSLADEIISNTVGHNRVRKSVERTWNWFKLIANSEELKNSDTKLFGTVVVDPNHKEQLKKMIDSYVQSNVAGLVVGGVHLGEPTDFRRDLIQSIRKESGEDMVLMAHGANTLEDIIDDIAQGIDIIHSTYCTVLTNSGSALLYNQSVKQKYSDVVSIETRRKRQRDEQEDSEQSSSKRIRTEDGAGDVSAILSSLGNAGDDEEGEGLKIEVSTSPIDRFSINLWDPIYRRDSRPLMPGCSCKACSRHTRAYVHHLLKSKELLAEILLYQHNQHQLQELFKKVREQVKEGKLESWASNTLSINL